MYLAHHPKASCIDATVSLLEGCLGCLILLTGCAGLPNQQASPGSWPATDAAHQAVMADGAQGGSTREESVPGEPPGDAPLSAGLPHQAVGGPQAGQAPQTGLPKADGGATTHMPGGTPGVGRDSQPQAGRKRKGDCMSDGSAAAATAQQRDMAADGMGATDRQGFASPSGGLAAPAGVFFDAVSWLTCMVLDCSWMFAVCIC